jgi:L-arabinokinase
LLVLRRERGVTFTGGVRLLLDSSVPEGKGVSSSAAIEVSAMQAVAGMVGENIAPRELALLCQKVENLVVGAPCGVMDQMTAACGEAGKLMALLCQPAELRGMVSIPDELAVWGIDSGIRHAVSGADYGSVRVGAFMGRKIIANGSGYLANITPSEFEPSRLPETILGAEFLARYGETGDPVTRIDPARTYAVRVPTMHPIHEHFRVSLFAELLPVRAGKLLGELMYQSHASYSACGLGSAGTDRLVALAREEGLLGAKITGGGSGGTVAVLGWREDDGKLQRVASRYADETGRAPFVFEGSSPGAAEFGVVRITKD